MRLVCRLLFVLGIAALALPEPARAQVAGYDTFRLLRTRNIFSPDRQATRSQTRTRTESTSERAPFLALTGTMVTPEKSLAFFSGSRPEYTQVVKRPAKIADMEVKSISASHVELEHEGRLVVLAVGQQVALGEKGPGEVANSPSAAPATTTSVPLPQTSSPDRPAPAGDRSELLRRMMERRQQQISK